MSFSSPNVIAASARELEIRTTVPVSRRKNYAPHGAGRRVRAVDLQRTTTTRLATIQGWPGWIWLPLLVTALQALGCLARFLPCLRCFVALAIHLGEPAYSFQCFLEAQR